MAEELEAVTRDEHGPSGCYPFGSGGMANITSLHFNVSA